MNKMNHISYHIGLISTSKKTCSYIYIYRISPQNNVLQTISPYYVTNSVKWSPNKSRRKYHHTIYIYVYGKTLITDANGYQ